MNETIRIRRANREDTASLTVLSEQLGYIASTDEILERLLKLHGMEEHAIFVAVDQTDSVLGWIHVLVGHRLVTETFAELGGLVVAEEYRGQGIGGSLLRKAEEWAVEKGLDLLRIRARSSRQRAHQFYTRMGYQLSKEQKIFVKSLNKKDD
jgi:GNAT superfamily N-acetyltransferase